MAPSTSEGDALTQVIEGLPEVDGRFFELRSLHSGAKGHFSRLFSATDRVTQQRVALKFLLPSLSGGYRDESFEREAVLLQHFLGHPDIIQLVSPRSEFTVNLMTQGGIPIPVPFAYFALELAETDVGTIIANEEQDANELLLVFRAMCRGVQRLHANSVVHRDLKPPNFLMMRDGTVRLSDLGTGKRIDDLATALRAYDVPPGDRRYCPPEMLAALHDESPRIAFDGDFFALGAILFEMFSGTVLGQRIYDEPFVADLVQAMSSVKKGQRRHIFDQLITSIADARPIPSVAAFGARVPSCLREPIDDLVRRLTALDYRNRLCDFSRVFNRISVCLLILRNEQKYQRWAAQQRRRREAAQLGRARRIL